MENTVVKPRIEVLADQAIDGVLHTITSAGIKAPIQTVVLSFAAGVGLALALLRPRRLRF